MPLTQGSVALTGRVAGAALVLCTLLVIDDDASRRRPAEALTAASLFFFDQEMEAMAMRPANAPPADRKRFALLRAGIVATASGLMLPPLAAQTGPIAGRGAAILIDDFESGTLASWTVNRNGAGGWFIYVKGQTPPEPSRSDPNVPFNVPDPPQGKFAAVTDMNGPGARILSRELRLDGRYVLRLIVFYVNAGEFGSPPTLAYDVNETNQQFRIDLVATSAPVDSLAQGDLLATVFRTSPGDPDRREPADVTFDLSPWQGRTVRLRLASVDNRGPLRVGVDNIRLEPIAK